MSDEKQKPFKTKIGEIISAIASSANITGKTNEDYKLESLFVDRLKKSLFKRASQGEELGEADLVLLAKQLSYEQKKHEFEAEKDKHKFRKWFLWALFGLTCAWLLIVVFFVGWNAVSPSVIDREKLLQLQGQLNVSNGGTNVLQSAMMRVANPKYCPILFHLSDSVLVAFITSTTVAVLGLFLTAARWLYGSTARKVSSDSKADKE